MTNINLYYSTNSGTDYTFITTRPAADGLYVWDIPDAVSNTARIKLTDAINEANVYDASTADFSLIGGFNITAPENGVILVAEDAANITWTTKGAGIPNVKLQFSSDGGTGYSATVALRR